MRNGGPNPQVPGEIKKGHLALTDQVALSRRPGKKVIEIGDVKLMDTTEKMFPLPC